VVPRARRAAGPGARRATPPARLAGMGALGGGGGGSAEKVCWLMVLSST
jgi:hypothetical protein